MNPMKTSLRTARSAHKVRLLLNESQKLEIGERLRELRENSPETNRSIADAIGVTERTVAAWVAGEQGMAYNHAQRVAKLFDVSFDWFWRGKESAQGEGLLDSLEKAGEPADVLSRLDTLEQRLDRVLELLEERAAEAAEDEAGRSEADETRKRGPGKASNG